MSDDTPKSFREFIDLWHSRAVFARAMGVRPDLARYWRHTNNIPERHWKRAIREAKRLGYPAPTYREFQSFARG